MADRPDRRRECRLPDVNRKQALAGPKGRF